MKRKHIQYSLRHVPSNLDRVVRERAQRDGISMNEAALSALEKGLGLAEEEVRYHDLDDLAGTWVKDPIFNKVIKEFDRVKQPVEMRILFDTNRYCDFCQGDRAVVAAVQQAESVYISFVTLAELRAGFLCGSLARKNESTLTRFLNRPRVGILQPDEATTHHYARVFAQLRKQGTPIPTHDMWLAALALQHDLLLLTRDRHFDHLPQLAKAI